MARTYKSEGTDCPRINLRRLCSFALDMFLCYIVSSALSTLWFDMMKMQAMEQNAAVPEMDQLMRAYFLIGTMVPLVVFKDVFGRSLGKLIFGLAIVEQGTDRCAPIGKRICRNLPLIVFPLEAIALLMSKTHTRMADKLLELQVVQVRKDFKR